MRSRTAANLWIFNRVACRDVDPRTGVFGSLLVAVLCPPHVWRRAPQCACGVQGAVCCGECVVRADEEGGAAA